MKTLLAATFSATLLVAGAASAQQAGAGANVGPIGAGATAGSQGVGAGAHVGPIGANVGLGFTHPVYYHHRVCRGGWYWHHHHRYCRRW
ncbi:MAG TPA: hypothetical protein VKR31_07705 [Rhizomicrobium sp.]|nr:hypothetical protein [Rhizomicrobium sp.]